jgi:hypothetical protein
MQQVRPTEEKTIMKVRFTALLAGFGLVVGLPLAAMAGPTPGGADADGDGVENAFDNCSSLGGLQADQKDYDHDGCGDRCDGDFDQNGGAGLSDFLALKKAFNTSAGNPIYDANPSIDMDCNGGVGLSDFLLFKVEFNTTAGPSGITNAGRDATACP